MGKMKNGSIVVTSSPLKILQDRTYLPVVLTVDIESNLPTLGAVQIIFNSANVRLHAHCRSSLTNSATYDQPTDNKEVTCNNSPDEIVDVYTIMGIKIRSQIKREQAIRELPNGLYIVGKTKILISNKIVK